MENIELKSEDSRTISYYDRVTLPIPSRGMTMFGLYKEIANPNCWKIQTEQLRTLSYNSNESQEFKRKHLSCVTPSGKFSERSLKGLIEHSRWLSFDVDDVQDIEHTKTLLLSDKDLDIELLFISPRGRGLKFIVEADIKTVEDHKRYFIAVQNYLQQKYQINIDPSGGDVSRACYLCYDPNAFIHPKYLNQ